MYLIFWLCDISAFCKSLKLSREYAGGHVTFMTGRRAGKSSNRAPSPNILMAKKEYLPAYYPLLIMLPGICAANAGSVINNFYWGRNYPLKIIAVPYIFTLFALGLDYLWPD